MRQAHADSSSQAVDSIDALQSKVDNSQITFFSELADQLKPVTQELANLSLAKAKAEFIMGAKYMAAQALALDAEADALAEAIRSCHISQGMRNFVAKK